MILRITSIDQFGVLDDFKWNRNNRLKDFKEKNIIYGWNYSGKTTLSRLFSSLRERKVHEDFSSAQFVLKTLDQPEINQSDINLYSIPVFVFNQEYIKSNLDWDSKTELGKPIAFDVGENVEIRHEINKLENSFNEIDQRKTEVQPDISNYVEFEKNKFTDWSKIIRLTVFGNTKKFDKGDFKKVLELISPNKVEEFIIKNDEEIEELKEISNAKDIYSRLDKLSYKSLYSTFENQAKELLIQEPSQEVIIDILDKNSDLRLWAEKGLEFPENKEVCSFCGNNVEPERIELLKNYFSNASQSLRNEINILKNAIDSQIKYISEFKTGFSPNDFSESTRSKYKNHLTKFSKIKKAYKNALTDLRKELVRKEDSNIFTRVDLKIDSFLEVHFDSWFEDLNTLIEKHNNFVGNFKENRSKARDILTKHLVSEYLKNENYFKKKELGLKGQKRLSHHQKYLHKVQIKIQEKRDSLKTITKGKKTLNTYIQKFLNRDDIKIGVTDEDKFLLYRGELPASNLSEGEKTAIAFSYFLTEYESTGIEEMCKTIVFIDDPISSLDTNHIAQVYSLINTFFFRKGIEENNPNKVVNCFKQIFISTHNFEFFSFLKDSRILTKKKKVKDKGTGKNIEVPNCEFYQIQKLDSQKSTIKPLPRELMDYKSEYIHLFKLVYEYKIKIDSGEDTYDILIPNALRRFLEIYTLMKIPNEPGSVENRVRALVGDINQYKLLNHFSHFTTFEKSARHDELLMVLPEATKEMFKLLELDKVHYNSLKKAIKAA